MEAKALATTTMMKVYNFVWKSIIYHFDLLQAIITDNGCQFDNLKFIKFCNGLCISHKLTLIAHPQSNCKAKVMNRTLLQELKAWLDQAKELLVEELYHVL